MDDRRFDSLAKSLAAGKSRRSVLKGLFGLGGTALVGGTLLEGETDAARRPTPTPKPLTCPGNQTPVNGVCTCPDTAPYECGPACCTGEAGDPPSPTHTECCDNACCHGTCYGEELCCPTNPGAGEQPPTHQVCTSAQGVECCPADQDCCEVDGCCETVCWGGEDGNSDCCPPGAFCPGDGTADICCTNNFICCGAGTSGNLCRDPNVANGCCTTEDCPSGQVCESNVCVTPCGPATVHIFAQTHGPLESQYVCPGPFQNVVTEIGLYSSGDGACGETAIATASTSADGPAIFENIPAGQYCALPTDQSLVTCLDCPDYGVGVGVDLTVPCGGLFQWTIGIASCCVEGETVAVLVHSGSGESGCNEGTHLAGVAVGLYDCDTDELLYGPLFSDDNGAANFASIPLGTYCVRLPADSPYTGCQRCQDDGLYRSRIEVTCGQTNYPLIGICRQGQHCDAGVCVDDPPCEGRCTDLEVCVDESCYCRPGTYDDFQGSCILCEAGTYSADRAAFECASCGLNTYQDQSGQTGCLPCPEGTYTEHIGSSSAEQCLACDCQAGNMPEICGCPPAGCQPGYASDGEACVACAAGTYSSDGTACVPCAMGTFTTLTGSEQCFTCGCGANCDPATGNCGGTVGVGGACDNDDQCASGVCGCGSPVGLPECMCRANPCFAEGEDCSSGFGAAWCCSGDCNGNSTDGYYCIAG